MISDEIRAAFLSFFEEKGHKIMPGSSLIPRGDPTLLLTSAGMVQFKPYFLGEALPPNPRLASCQKCFRATDIESVGDPSHLTFFEMLGNFSIGDYFKQEAINWAWEFVTQRLSLSPQRLWITIFLDDDESFHYWHKLGVPEHRILRFGEQDNFWGPAGSSGPCGPCSEIHYDFGEEFGCKKASCAPGCDCGRFSEIWNLVFTQYNQDEDGRRTLLPKPNIDTGMGLERTAAVVQDRTSVYETDLFAPLLECISELAGIKYGSDNDIDNTIRIIAEHSRGIAFLIGDGVIPSNEGRGYVLRRLLRRAQYFGETLAHDKPLLVGVAKEVIANMGHIYAELVTNRKRILDAIESEVENFRRTLPVGRAILQQTLIKMREELAAYFPKFEKAFKEAISKRRIEGSGSLTSGIRDAVIDFRRESPDLRHTLIVGGRDVIKETLRPIEDALKELEQAISDYTVIEFPRAFTALKVNLGVKFENLKESVDKVSSEITGLELFILYDTWGFPVELTKEIAAGRGFSVDLEGFEKEMEKQRQRSRDVVTKPPVATVDVSALSPEVVTSKFVGYHTLTHKSNIIDLWVNNESVDTIQEGQEASLILEETPFYGEMGGQVGDTGEIQSLSGRFSVTNTIRVLTDIIIHLGYVAEASLTRGDEVEAEVDVDRRLDIARNHTATHLLQLALRQVLGEHVQQRGSLVAPDRLRFDFSHLTAMTTKEIEEVQHIVNEKIRQNLRVYDEDIPYKKAIEEGAIALFDEKYGDVVRVVKIGKPAISAELCGGTHVASTGEIGFFQIITEMSIGAGLRRIEAVTGRGAETLIDRRLSDLQKAAEYLDAELDDVLDKAYSISIGLKEERRQRLAVERELAKKEAESLLSQAEVINGVTVLVAKVRPFGRQVLREMSDLIRERLKSVVVVLGTVYEDKPIFLATVTPDLVAKGYNAGEIVKQVAKVTGGSGGGKATLAQAGGRYKDKLDEALRLVKNLI